MPIKPPLPTEAQSGSEQDVEQSSRPSRKMEEAPAAPDVAGTGTGGIQENDPPATGGIQDTPTTGGIQENDPQIMNNPYYQLKCDYHADGQIDAASLFVRGDGTGAVVTHGSGTPEQFSGAAITNHPFDKEPQKFTEKDSSSSASLVRSMLEQCAERLGPKVSL